MGKMIRLSVAVPAEKIADALDTMRGFGRVVVSTGDDDAADLTTAGADETDDDTPVVSTRGRKRIAPAMAGRTVRARTIDNRPKLYTAAGTAKQVRAALESLSEGSVAAVVLADLAKNGQSSNADVRKRVAKRGVNPESVDNAIWNLVNRKLVTKEVAAE